MHLRLTPRSMVLDDLELLAVSLNFFRDFADLETTTAKRMQIDLIISDVSD